MLALPVSTEGPLGFNADSFQNAPIVPPIFEGWTRRSDLNFETEELVRHTWAEPHAGFVAVAAGAITPGVSNSIHVIFSKIASVMTNATS